MIFKPNLTKKFTWETKWLKLSSWAKKLWVV